MKFTPHDPPRKFVVGHEEPIEISDCGRVLLDPDEQITFITPSNKEYDVARKSWGFYATPSINGRLKTFGFKTAMVKSREGRYYIMLVEEEKLAIFKDYITMEGSTVIEWLDER